MTESYLCHACSCQEILRAETAGQEADVARLAKALEQRVQELEEILLQQKKTRRQLLHRQTTGASAADASSAVESRASAVCLSIASSTAL